MYVDVGFFQDDAGFGREKNLTFFPKPASFFSKPERIPACRFFIEVGFGKTRSMFLKCAPTWVHMFSLWARVCNLKGYSHVGCGEHGKHENTCSHEGT
jgi:hypothetical protein